MDFVETETYEMPVETYLVCEWYAQQMELTVDYLLDEFFIDGTLVLPSELVDYDYECDS